jgi:hypothetical protein
MIYFTGDTHGDLARFSSKNFPVGKTLTKSDYVVILGDFGCIWYGDRRDEYNLKWLQDKPWTTLFVDGNHESFFLLNQYPVMTWNGGKIHRINDSVFHLMRGQVFNIDSNTFMTMGGASSIDKYYRTEGKSWWKEEMPTEEEKQELLTNLEKYDYKVDYVLTHTCPFDIFNFYANASKLGLQNAYFNHELEHFFDTLVFEKKLIFKRWLFGHMHKDKIMFTKYIGMYTKIIGIDEL